MNRSELTIYGRSIFRSAIVASTLLGCAQGGDNSATEQSTKSLSLLVPSVEENRRAIAFSDSLLGPLRGETQIVATTARHRVEPLARVLASESQAFKSAVSRVFAQRACAKSSRAEMAALSFTMQAYPAVASIGAIECLLSSWETEDIVVWDAIDAWNSIGKPPSPVVEAARKRAQLFDTKRRFLTPAEVAQIMEAMPFTQTITARIVSGSERDL
jgi:hypothetical protein